jgi:hypothetical protein
VTRGTADLRFARSAVPGETLIYQISYPFQVAERQAGLFVNLRLGHAPSQDFEAGADVVLFDDLTGIGRQTPIPITRNQEGANPHDQGRSAMMVKYPVCGGFVPLGAKRADGSPHPHAGTGFGNNQSKARQLGKDPYYRGDFSRNYQVHEVHQLAYDGTTFRVVETDVVPMDALVPGWLIHHAALGNAIPDGDDFLLPMAGKPLAGKPDRPKDRFAFVPIGSGVTRWKRTGGAWKPVSFVPVTSTEAWAEPSMVRDVDGSLLFCSRDEGAGFTGPGQKVFGGAYTNDLSVWRSRDGGQSWQLVLRVRTAVIGPVSLNQAADGTPYVCSNLFEVQLFPLADRFARRDAEGRQRLGGWLREKLCLWPLAADRTRVETGVMVRDCRGEFGVPPNGSTWIADHPVGGVVQLADGAWHGVLGYRLLEAADRDDGLPASSRTGAYVEEILSDGPAIPRWKFS